MIIYYSEIYYTLLYCTSMSVCRYSNKSVYHYISKWVSKYMIYIYVLLSHVASVMLSLRFLNDFIHWSPDSPACSTSQLVNNIYFMRLKLIEFIELIHFYHYQWTTKGAPSQNANHKYWNPYILYCFGILDTRGV